MRCVVMFVLCFSILIVERNGDRCLWATECIARIAREAFGILFSSMFGARKGSMTLNCFAVVLTCFISVGGEVSANSLGYDFFALAVV